MSLANFSEVIALSFVTAVLVGEDSCISKMLNLGHIVEHIQPLKSQYSIQENSEKEEIIQGKMIERVIMGQRQNE